MSTQQNTETTPAPATGQAEIPQQQRKAQAIAEETMVRVRDAVKLV